MTEKELQQISNGIDMHWAEANKYFKHNNIVLLGLQGSQNYDLQTENSDIDTKLIVTPSFDDVARGRQPVSTTHVLENNEHIDFKDIRLMFQTFRKQNINFIEILFTQYYQINCLYEEEWNRLIARREDIAHANIYAALKAMKGMVMEKRAALQKQYPAKLEVLAKFGYDPKQLHHILRLRDFIVGYLEDEKYEKLLIPENANYLKAVKQGVYNVDSAIHIADSATNWVINVVDETCAKLENKFNQEIADLLDDVQINIMKISLKNEILQ